MGALTTEEKAQIRDHMGWSNGLFMQDYSYIYVQPVLDGLTDDAKLAIVRAHLQRLNAIYTALDGLVENLNIREVKGIVFDATAEGRLWALYASWLKRLCRALDLSPNRQASGGRRIL